MLNFHDRVCWFIPELNDDEVYFPELATGSKVILSSLVGVKVAVEAATVNNNTEYDLHGASIGVSEHLATKLCLDLRDGDVVTVGDYIWKEIAEEIAEAITSDPIFRV